MAHVPFFPCTLEAMRATAAKMPGRLINVGSGFRADSIRKSFGHIILQLSSKGYRGRILVILQAGTLSICQVDARLP